MTKTIKYHEGFPDTPQIRAAINELVELISSHYQEAIFDVTPAPEDTQVAHLYTTVDRIDTDELVDLVIDREMALQEQGVPLHVIPLRTPEREAQVRTQVAEERKHFSL